MNKKVVTWIIALVVIIAAVLYIVNKTPKTTEMTDTNSTGETAAPAQQMNPADYASSTRKAQNGDVIIVHYTGTLQNGTKFDSSLDRGQPLGVILGKGMVIPGWEEGLLGLKKGDKKKLTIPAAKGYKDQEIKDESGKVIIPANSTLIFDIEVMDVIPADKLAELMQAQAPATN